LVKQIKKLAEDARPKKRRFNTETQRSRRKILLPRLAVLQFVDPQFLSASILRDLCASVVNPN